MNDAVRNRPNELSRLRSEHRALAILRLLDRQPGYRSNELLIADWLAMIGLAGSWAETRDLLETLERKRLVKLETAEGVMVAELTEQGLDAAKGVMIVEGVLRPGPECPF
jgi:DNA-binding GntR family transcriptional regulator